ncbi:uncharacterized protein LOC115214308 isoform X2 [Octopus sinensis]|uniref:Uncharacterized protein LOC115214308 isoform X2 n=1 Tax=Octopus sinensis TaxID=2607531 RepID=A0A6P7SM25_9MOLL|nr:uncharacterized protein LOC115214308 isoform X2 [Octopus sinensis]
MALALCSINEGMETPEKFAETFNVGLKGVFQKLLKREKPITDDTSLQKLCDFVPEFVTTIEAVKLCWADDFLKASVIELNTSNASLLFATQIAGSLAQNEVIFNHYEKVFTEFYSSVFNSTYWSKCVSLKTALFTTLRKTIQHIPGFSSVTRTFPGVPNKALDVIYKESSIFLTKEASKFLSQLLIQSFQINDVSPEVLQMRDNLLDTFWDVICHNTPNCSNPKSKHSKELLFDILKDAGGTCKYIWNWTVNHKDSFSELHQLITTSQSWDVAIDLYLCLLLNHQVSKNEKIEKVLVIFHQIDSKEEDDRVRSFVEKLMKSFLSTYPDDALFSELMEKYYQPKLKFFNYITNSTGCNKQISLNDINPPECEARLCNTIECLERLVDPKLLQKDIIKTTIQLSTTCFLKFFHKTTDTESLQTSEYYQFFKVISNSTKLLLKMLHYFQKLACNKSEFLISQDCQVMLINILVNIVQEIGQNLLVVSQSFDCLWLYMLPVLKMKDAIDSTDKGTNNTMTDSTVKDLPSKVSSVIKYCLCHPQWEIRDSAMEFLSKSFAASNTPELQSWVQENKLHSLAYSSLSDGESYVRATCISALLHLLNIDDLWSNFLSTVEKSPADIQQDIMNILETDSEAFARRAAAKFLLKLSKTVHGRNQLAVFHKAMYNVLQDDLDWEVKKVSIEYWESIIISEEQSTLQSTTNVPSYAAGLVMSGEICKACTNCKILKMLSKLQQINCIDSLLLAYRDCDYSVQEEAGRVLVNLKKFLAEHIKLEDIGQCLVKTVNMEDAQDLYQCCSKDCCRSCERSAKKHKGVAFVEMLSELDVSSYLQDCQMNCDLYIKNPLSLIEDILADCDEGEMSEEDDENVLDCY